MSEHIVVYRCRQTITDLDLYLSRELTITGTTTKLNLAKRFDSRKDAESAAITHALFDHLHLPAQVIRAEPEPEDRPETVKAELKGYLDDAFCRIHELERRFDAAQENRARISKIATDSADDIKQAHSRLDSFHKLTDDRITELERRLDAIHDFCSHFAYAPK